jgi:uncharacterized membrane protein YphA (DoxX/SURF4 family)
MSSQNHRKKMSSAVAGSSSPAGSGGGSIDRSPTTTSGMTAFLLMARLIVGGILLYAGFMKAMAPLAEFVAAIDAYHLLPYKVITPLAFGLPWIEMWVGIFLIAGYAMRLSASLATMLFTMFFGVLGSAIARGIDLSSCGCFGSETMSPRQTIGMDAILLAFSIGLIRLSAQPRPYSLDNWFRKP